MARGGGCRDERRGSSASEVGTDDGTAKNKTKQKRYRNTVTYLIFVRSMYLIVTCMPGNSYRWRPRALSFVTHETFVECIFLTQFVSILTTGVRSPGPV